MQTYNLKLTATAPQVSFVAAANLFVYESGAGPTSTAETRILVKADSGGEITLRPGQSFRLPPGETAMQWLVRSYDNAAVINGAVIIGAGEFVDANTNNVVTLGEGFANQVKVNNTTAERVPVSIDTAQKMPVSVPDGVKITNTTGERIPVTLDQNSSITTTDPVMAYTNSKKVAYVSSTVTALITPAENVAGVIVEQVITTVASSLVAKSSLPGAFDDGDLVEYSNAAQASNRKRVKLAPGKGLYVHTNVSSGTAYVLWTAL
jgi:predicted nucleic acid-binding protein